MPLAQRLVLLALVPASVAMLIACALLAHYHVKELSRLSHWHAQAVVAQLAALVQQPLARGDRGALQQIVQAGSWQAGVHGMRVLAPDGEVLAQGGLPDTADDAATYIVRETINPGDAGQVEIVVAFSPSLVKAAWRNQAWILLALLIGSLLAIGLSCWWVARRISAPIRTLAEAVDRLGGGAQASVDVADNAEIGRLQRGFNRAARALIEHQGTQQELIDRATAQLTRQNAQLQALSEAKTRLLATASHDLRQPLYALTLFSDALGVSEKDPARQAHIDHIRECVQSLDRLFSELLDLSRLDSGIVQPVWRDLALDDLFNEVSRNFRPVAEQRGLRLVVRKTDLCVRSDHAMLARILNNLVSNALRHTHDGGVLLGARRSGGRVRVDVWDTGIGIEPACQHRVFDEFYQVDDAPSNGVRRLRGERGLGLGLSTVKRLCELMNVPMRLCSRPGRGTVLTLWLQSALSGLAALAIRPSGEDPLEVRGLRALVIDDEPDILEGLSMVLGNWGMVVEKAGCRNEAMALARRWHDPPDIVLTDLLLREGADGLTLLHEIEQLPNVCGRAPAKLFITGETKPERLHEIATAQIPALHKPVTTRVLREAIVASIAARNVTLH